MITVVFQDETVLESIDEEFEKFKKEHEEKIAERHTKEVIHNISEIYGH